MDGMLAGNESDATSVSNNLQDNEVAPGYVSRQEIEKNSPSRRDGIDLEEEIRLRKSYCVFLRDLGIRLKADYKTLSTAIVFCHRFFLRQSHAKNDRWAIATACMFLAGKVEENPRHLKDVTIISYEIIHKNDVAAPHIKEVYKQQRQLVLRAEKLVISTLNFDLSVGHPFKPFVDAVKKYKVDKAKAQFRQVAESFFSKCYLTTLCLQYKPSHIAAGVLFLAAEHLNMNLQSYGEGLYQDFDIAPRQLEEICGQMLELFVNKHISTSQGSIVERSNRRDIVQQPVSKEMASTDKCPSSDTGGSPSKANLSQSNDHLVHDDVSRPEGIEKDNSESEAGENRDGHSIRTVTSEASDDIGVSLVEKDLQLRSEEVKGKGEKDDNDMSEREVEDVELDDEDDKTMEKISPSFSKVGYSDSNSVEHSEN